MSDDLDDALYVYIEYGRGVLVSKTVAVKAGEVMLDYDAEGRLIGIEILGPLSGKNGGGE